MLTCILSIRAPSIPPIASLVLLPFFLLLLSLNGESEIVSLSRVQLFVTPWTVAFQAPLSMGFSRQEYWRGCISYSRGSSLSMMELVAPASQAESLPLSHQGSLYNGREQRNRKKTGVEHRLSHWKEPPSHNMQKVTKVQVTQANTANLTGSKMEKIPLGRATGRRELSVAYALFCFELFTY